MTFKPVFAIVSFGLLASCSLQLQHCIDVASADLKTLESSIIEAEENIHRGYAVHKQTVPYTFEDTCETPKKGEHTCLKTENRIKETPVSISIPEERKKLEALYAQRPAFEQRRQYAIDQCYQTYPQN